MTLEEIKQTVTMKDVLTRYGVEVKGNMCCCPIHKERHPSMQIFKDGYKCHACQSHGDIFEFVQVMEGCDFKTAFKLLGGTYKHHSSRESRINAKVHFERQKQAKLRAERQEKDFRKILMGTISLCEWLIDNEEPLSDDWCYAQNKLPWLWHVYETKYFEGEEVNEVNVFRAYREIRQRFTSG